MISYTGFLKSVLTLQNPFITLDGVKEWLQERNRSVRVSVQRIPFKSLNHWQVDRDRGLIAHSSGKFFTIEGINVKTNWGKVPEWEQPIINQPEIGYLGIITKEIDGVLYFLLQAKIEPGNINCVQLSPTLQATRSNYQQVHKGKKPAFLEYFQNAKPSQVLLDQLQSEQGARFLRKRNRNIIIKVEENIPEHEDFIWLTLAQIKELISYNNLVNMDTRTVISGIPFGKLDHHSIESMSVLSGNNNGNAFGLDMLRSATNESDSVFTFDEILNWLSSLKCHYEVNIKPLSIFKIKNWQVLEDEIIHDEKKYFKVIAARIEIGNREVTHWDQPLVEPMQEGLIAFIIKKINGIYHFLVQAKVESGNFDVVEMAPTVQCITGSYLNSSDVPYLDYVLKASPGQIRSDTLQSEEGGRFYREQNRNLIIEADENFAIESPANYKWVSLHQMTIFLKFNNYLNIQSRSLISAIKFI